MPTPGTIAIPFNAQKLAAIAQFSGEKDPPLADVLTATTDKIYQKRVSAAVRQFIEREPAPPSKSRKERS